MISSLLDFIWSGLQKLLTIQFESKNLWLQKKKTKTKGVILLKSQYCFIVLIVNLIKPQDNKCG